MAKFTKELAKLFRKITNSEIDAEGNAHVVLSPADSLLINNARIALASLEADDSSEPVAFINGAWELVYYRPPKELGLKIGDKLYTAPPAPVALPSGYSDFEEIWSSSTHPLTQDDEMKDFAWDIWNACRAAMLKHSEPFIVTSDHRMMEMPQVEAINAVTAMLQGADGNAPAHFRSRPAQSSISPAQGGNSPVIPDGWVLVPEEPTHEMLEAGDEQFGTYDVYRRMIAASPQQEA
ncbi:TPA: hypothetical protein NEG61_004202 [Enterobacter hormaechei]|nr:hypothetical protein [Enterobacter hormaechei]